MNHRLFLFMIFLILAPLSSRAHELELFPLGSEKMREKMLVLNGGRKEHIIYFLEDHTVVYLRRPPWKIPTQSWIDWWDDIPPMPVDSKFYFQIETWASSSSPFQIYRYQSKWNPSSPHPLEELFNQYQNLIFDYPHLIENKETGEMTLCKILSLDDLISFIQGYGEECYDKGYSSGETVCN